MTETITTPIAVSQTKTAPSGSWFSLLKDRHFWMFLGSGLIVSTAYMDPGNWGTNIGGGAGFGYNLLWVIWLASGMAMLFQYLSGKLGIAGYSLPELVREKLGKKSYVMVYWLLAELIILATDLAEFLGIVVALNLLFGIPMLWGSLIAIADVLLILLLTQKRFRLLEQLFLGMVSLISLVFVYELFITKPDTGAILFHSVVPHLTPQSALLAVGIVGATVMPHALFVHSWLIKNKVISSGITDKVKTLRYHIVDNIASLTVAALVNAAMLVMAAASFGHIGDVTIEQAYHTLVPAFGAFAATAFALGLLAAGISSSITGTLSGQAVMDGLTGFKVNPWVRRLVTRGLNLIPLLIAILIGADPLHLLVYSQVVLCLLIPLPLVPLLLFTADKNVMGELVNNKTTTAFAWFFGAIILAMNVYLLVSVL